MSTIDIFQQARKGHSVQQRGIEFIRVALAVIAFVAIWLDEKMERRRSRRLLQELSDYQLKDIGISRADAFNEGRRPFWD